MFSTSRASGIGAAFSIAISTPADRDDHAAILELFPTDGMTSRSHLRVVPVTTSVLQTGLVWVVIDGLRRQRWLETGEGFAVVMEVAMSQLVFPVADRKLG